MYMRTVIGIPIYGCEYRFTLYMIHGIRNRKNPWAGNILCKCDAKLHFKGTESDTWLRVRKRESYSALLGETMLIEDPSFFPLSLSLSEMKGFSISKLSTLLISFVSTFSSLSLLIEFIILVNTKVMEVSSLECNRTLYIAVRLSYIYIV